MKLKSRELTVVVVGGLILAVLLGYVGVVEPLAARRDRLKTLNARLEKDLADMEVLAAQYREAAGLKARLDRLMQARGPGFAPFSYLENLAGESGLTGKIESMAPVAASSEDRARMTEVDVRLSGIGLMELVRFLYKLETSDKVFLVINLNIRPRYLSPDKLDVFMRLASPTAT